MSDETSAAVEASNANAKNLAEMLDKHSRALEEIKIEVAATKASVLEKQNQTDANILEIKQKQGQTDANVAGLVVKIDQLVISGIRMTAVCETALTFVKASPAVIALLAAFCGGLLWLIKHA